MPTKASYLAETVIFVLAFAVAVTVVVQIQIRAKRINLFLFWTEIIATTTVGTILPDLLGRPLGIGYAGSSTILSGLLMASL